MKKVNLAVDTFIVGSAFGLVLCFTFLLVVAGCGKNVSFDQVAEIGEGANGSQSDGNNQSGEGNSSSSADNDSNNNDSVRGCLYHLSSYKNAVCKINQSCDQCGDDGHCSNCDCTKGARSQGGSIGPNTGSGSSCRIRMPKFSSMVPFGEVFVQKFDASGDSAAAFTGGPADVREYFGIRFRGKISIPACGEYRFKLSSDDGSILSINGVLVIDNDGEHGLQAREGTIFLCSGKHSFTLDYFQAKSSVALKLEWRIPGTSGFEIIPESALSPLENQSSCLK